MKKKVLVIGAGLSGATSARILAESGYEVFIIDSKEHVAGHCHDKKNNLGITVHTYGPHIFHTNEKSVWDFLHKFTEFSYYQHRVLSYAQGQYYKFPINRDTICQVLGVDIPTYEVKNYLNLLVKSSSYNSPPNNFKDFVISQVGETLFDLFYKNYTYKQWRKKPEELDSEIAKRIPVRENRDDRYFSDQYQGIPIEGYTKMVENILDHENINIELQKDYFEYKGLNKPVLTVYTGELDRFFNYSEGRLGYRSLRLEMKNIEKEYYQSVATVNYPNDYDWTRITEYKYFLNEKSEMTTVCFEYPRDEGDPYYILLTKENTEKRNKYLQKVKVLEESKNYLFLGRLAEYKYYNMDQVVLNSIVRIKEWISKQSL